MSANQKWEPGTTVGRWRVVECLGEGGQGAVYRVEDTEHPGDFYALKRAFRARDGRAEREVVLLMSRAVHPHVVRFHACARWPHPREGALGFIMDWVPGRALDAWAETEGTTARQLATVGATVAYTLGELHARGVLHRDLKPEHIVISEEDGEPVLLDFGVGWYEGAAPLTTGPLPPATRYLLTPEAVLFLWGSPQNPGAHYASRPADDLYALGVCLYRAVTGHYPFSEWLSDGLLQYAIVHLKPLSPALVNPRVPQALSDIIVRLLEKDPGNRYANGAALHAALTKAASGKEPAWDEALYEWEEVPSTQEGDPFEHHLRRPSRPRPDWTAPSAAFFARVRRGPRWPWVFVLATTALLLLLTLMRAPLTPGGRFSDEQRTAEADKALPSDEAEVAPQPGSHQKRAPCTAELEVELSGACWLWLVKQRPPHCPPQTHVYRSQCLWPVPNPHPVPTSMDGGAPERLPASPAGATGR